MRNLRAFALCAALATLTACSGESPADLMGSAKDYLAKGDVKAAMIQLKTVLQTDPASAEARFLLGKALLDSGDTTAATIELEKALDLKYPEQTVAPEIARALRATGEFQRLVDKFGQRDLDDPKAQADLQASLAAAYGALGRLDDARKAVDKALKAMPGHGPATHLQARLLADAGDLDGALAAISQIIEKNPQDFEAWLVKAELLVFGKHDTAGALAAYRRAIEIKPSYAPAHAGAMTMLLGSRDLEGAKAQLVHLQKALPNHPQTRYFEGNIALLSKDLDKAKAIADELLAIGPNNARVLQFAGGVAHERRDFTQAELHLSRAIQFAPRLDAARRLLALTQLRLSQPAKALATLQPLLDQAAPTAQTYSLVAQAHLQAGDITEAETYFGKAAKLNPDDVRTRTAVAVTRLVQGDNAGMAELESIAAADSGTAADLPLISALVRKKDYAGALRAIDALEKKLTGPQPMVWNLRARVHLRKGDVKAARLALEKALEIKPSFYPAAAALAGLDLMDRNVDAAKKRFDSVLAADPGNVQALLASASLKARTGAPREEVLATFQNAIKQGPEAVPPRLALVRYHLALNESTLAVAAAQQGVAAIPNQPDLLDALGRALISTRDLNQAESTYNKLAQLQRNSALPLLRLAEIHLMSGNRDDAVQQLKRALVLDPDNLLAQKTLSDVHIAERRFDAAIQIAREIQKKHPKREIGYALEGAAQAAQKHWEPAIAVYRAGLKAVPGSTELGARLHSLLEASGQRGEAERFMSQWLREHPADAAFQFYLGDVAMMRGQLPQAEARYREVIKLQPDNALALNNVAWLLATGKKPGAVEMAERADRLLVNRPTIMDTLALALASDGQVAKAVAVLRQALAIDPSNAQIRLNLAKTLIQAGDKPSAKTELKEVLKLGSKFPRQDEVRELLSKL